MDVCVPEHKDHERKASVSKPSVTCFLTFSCVWWSWRLKEHFFPLLASAVNVGVGHKWDLSWSMAAIGRGHTWLHVHLCKYWSYHEVDCVGELVWLLLTKLSSTSLPGCFSVRVFAVFFFHIAEQTDSYASYLLKRGRGAVRRKLPFPPLPRAPTGKIESRSSRLEAP